MLRSGFFSYLILGAQASGTQIEAFPLSVYGKGNWMDIGQPVAVGTMFRVTYIMTKLGGFPTQITFHNGITTSLLLSRFGVEF